MAIRFYSSVLWSLLYISIPWNIFFFSLSYEASAFLQYLEVLVGFEFSGFFNKLCICTYEVAFVICSYELFNFSFGESACGRNHWIVTVIPSSLCLTSLILKQQHIQETIKNLCSHSLQHLTGFHMNNNSKPSWLFVYSSFSE